MSSTRRNLCEILCSLFGHAATGNITTEPFEISLHVFVDATLTKRLVKIHTEQIIVVLLLPSHTAPSPSPVGPSPESWKIGTRVHCRTRILRHRSTEAVKVTSALYRPRRWRFGSAGNVVGRINEVNQRRARLVLGWVTVCRRVNHPGM